MNREYRRAGAWTTMAAVLFLAASTGCTTYELGASLPPGLNTIHIPTVANETGEPLLETEVTRALLREIQRDGSLRIADAESADGLLEVVLTKFELAPVRYDRDDRETTEEYRMVIVARTTLTLKTDAEPMMVRTLVGDATFDFFGDLASSKRQATPQASRDLALEIVGALVEYW